MGLSLALQCEALYSVTRDLGQTSFQWLVGHSGSQGIVHTGSSSPLDPTCDGSAYMRARPCHLRIRDLDKEGGEGLFSPPRRVVDGNVAKEEGKGKPSPRVLDVS